MGKQKPEIYRARATAWSWFSKYMRTLRCMEEMGDAEFGRCVTCDEVKPYTKLDCGHFVNGRSDSVLFVEDNVACQCVGCNRFKSGQWVPFYDYQVRTFGIERVRELMALYYSDAKYSVEDFRDIAKIYREKYKRLDG